MAEINLWLDSYDEIYSDFDSRHYLKRRISEDFLYELHTEMKHEEYNAGHMILFLPADQRDETSEKTIAESLNGFFAKQFHFYKEECQMKLYNGILLFATGVIIMLLYSWISLSPEKSFVVIGLKVLLEPAGWFLLWVAFDFLVYDFAKIKKERIFYKGLSKMHVHFKSS